MSDNKDTIINCPACGNPMKKIFMPKQGVHLDVCVDGCGGIYFDNREFSMFDEPNEDISPLTEILKGKGLVQVDESQVRVCPVCGSDMVKNYASIKHEIQVDECYHCGGKFLDYGELEKIRSQYNTESERSADVIKKLYSDVGIELIDKRRLTGMSGQQNGKIKGFQLGLLFAAIWLIYKNAVIIDFFDNPLSGYTPIVVVIAVAIAIICLFVGFGCIIGKKSK